jgi:hypothetical protein
MLITAGRMDFRLQGETRTLQEQQPTKFELAINLKTFGATAVTYCR